MLTTFSENEAVEETLKIELKVALKQILSLTLTPSQMKDFLGIEKDENLPPYYQRERIFVPDIYLSPFDALSVRLETGYSKQIPLLRKLTLEELSEIGISRKDITYQKVKGWRDIYYLVFTFPLQCLLSTSKRKTVLPEISQVATPEVSLLLEQLSDWKTRRGECSEEDYRRETRKIRSSLRRQGYKLSQH